MQRIKIKVVPNAGRNEIKPVPAKAGKEDERYKVYLTAPAIEGRANKKLIEALAEYFGVKKSGVRIVRGERDREKLIEIG